MTPTARLLRCSVTSLFRAPASPRPFLPPRMIAADNNGTLRPGDGTLFIFKISGLGYKSRNNNTFAPKNSCSAFSVRHTTSNLDGHHLAPIWSNCAGQAIQTYSAVSCELWLLFGTDLKSIATPVQRMRQIKPNADETASGSKPERAKYFDSFQLTLQIRSELAVS